MAVGCGNCGPDNDQGQVSGGSSVMTRSFRCVGTLGWFEGLLLFLLLGRRSTYNPSAEQKREQKQQGMVWEPKIFFEFAMQ